MRRGLMRWDATELPEASLTQRTERVQAALQAEGFDALVIYTNNVRPAAVAYLTAFTPYWSDAILLLPRTGKSIFATSLSKRVLNWIRSTNPVSEIVNTPRPGVVVGAKLAADASVRRVGVLEFDMLPFGIFDDLTKGAPDLEFADASAAFAKVRMQLDEAEDRLLRQADDLAQAALAVTPVPGQPAGALLGDVELRAREAGVEEAYLAVAPDLRQTATFIRNPGPVALADCCAVSLSVAFKGAWVRRTRCFTTDPVVATSFAAAEAWWQRTSDALLPGQPIAHQLQTAMAGLPGAVLRQWSVEACCGSYTLQRIASATRSADFVPAPQSMLVVSVELQLGELNWIATAPVLLGAEAA